MNNSLTYDSFHDYIHFLLRFHFSLINIRFVGSVESVFAENAPIRLVPLVVCLFPVVVTCSGLATAPSAGVNLEQLRYQTMCIK